MSTVLYVYKVCTHRGNKKYKAIGLDIENFSWDFDDAIPGKYDHRYYLQCIKQ